MLKKKALKRIFITTVAIFIVLILYTLTGISEDTIIYDDAIYINENDKKVIYALNKDDYVSKTTVYVDNNLSIEEKIKTLLEIMVEKNNKNALLPSNFKPILPKNTEILEVSFDIDILKVNFSKELMNITDEQSEKMLEAIIYTLTEFDDVLGIEIYVENQLLEYIPNTNKKTPTILTKDFGINKVYDINNNKDINKVYLYYFSKQQDDLYYVPVTKYLNDNREKIEIIVEELSNFYVYDANLVSFLDNNVTLLDYSINDDKMILKFNDKIQDENELSIMALMYSIFDNYDVEKIEILAEDAIFLEKTRKNIE